MASCDKKVSTTSNRTAHESREHWRGEIPLLRARRGVTLCRAQGAILRVKAEVQTFLKLIATLWKQGKISGVSRKNLFIATMSRQENKCMYRRESSLPIPSKYINDVKQTKPIWTILSECQSGSTRFRILNKRPYQDCSWVDGRIKPKHKSHRDQKRFGQKCGYLCPNVFKRKQNSNGIWINPKYKLHARRGNFTICFLTTLKNLTPLFRTSERSWKFQWNQQCATRIRTSRQDTDAKSCSVKSVRSEIARTEPLRNPPPEKFGTASRERQRLLRLSVLLA